MPAARDALERFEEKYIPEPNSGCWIWTASLRCGYGQFGSYQVDLAHRQSWRFYRSEIPDGLFVLHRCDNRACVNPDHLFLGTQKDNIRDMMKKGRRRADKRGEDVYNSKLTDADVVAIQASSETQRALAKQYGVGPTTIWEIRAGRRWKHVRG